MGNTLGSAYSIALKSESEIMDSYEGLQLNELKTLRHARTCTSAWSSYHHIFALDTCKSSIVDICLS